MVELIDSDIRTREVLSWDGLHVLHGRMSSCSQKLRIFLNLKGIEWQGHEMNLAESETYSDWFMGINPRGLVPVVVWDGRVFIESNDILAMFEEKFPEPCLFPANKHREIDALLQQEDDLHLDLRTLSFRFVLGRTGSNKSSAVLDQYRGYDAKVAGEPDIDRREHELDFYERLAEEGLSDDLVRVSAKKFWAAFDELETRLSASPYFLGEKISVLDIAWFVYASRLHLGGYPFARLFPNIHEWRQGLASDERFAQEVLPPAPLQELIARNQAAWAQAGTTLSDVVGL